MIGRASASGCLFQRAANADPSHGADPLAGRRETGRGNHHGRNASGQSHRLSPPSLLPMSAAGHCPRTTTRPSSPPRPTSPTTTVVADVKRERHDAPAAVAPADGKTQHRQHVPQPARLVLADHAGRDRDALRPRGGRQRHGVLEARLLRRCGHVDQHVVAESVGEGASGPMPESVTASAQREGDGYISRPQRPTTGAARWEVAAPPRRTILRGR